MAGETKSFISRLLFPVKERGFPGFFEGLFSGILFIPILFSFYPLAFRFSMVNFTYGAHGMDPVFKSMLPAYFLKIFLATYFLGIVFRGGVLRLLLRLFDWRTAFILHLILINLILSLCLWKVGHQMPLMGFLRYWLMENLIIGFWSLYFLRTGSLIVTSALSALYGFVRFVVINDVTGPFETLYFYSAASDDFYWLMITVTVLAISILLWWNQAKGMRELRALRNEN